MITPAASLYDAHMQFYVQALAANGSAHAYPTLGSTIAVHAESYNKYEATQNATPAKIFTYQQTQQTTSSASYRAARDWKYKPGCHPERLLVPVLRCKTS